MVMIFIMICCMIIVLILVNRRIWLNDIEYIFFFENIVKCILLVVRVIIKD